MLYAFPISPMHSICPSTSSSLIDTLIIISGEDYNLWTSSLDNYIYHPVTSSLSDPNILLQIDCSNNWLVPHKTFSEFQCFTCLAAFYILQTKFRIVISSEIGWKCLMVWGTDVIIITYRLEVNWAVCGCDRQPVRCQHTQCLCVNIGTDRAFII
jgi:hypothetical protein